MKVTWWNEKFQVGKKYHRKDIDATYLCLAFNTSGFPVFERVDSVFVLEYNLQNSIICFTEEYHLCNLQEVKEPRKAMTRYVGVYELKNKKTIFIDSATFSTKERAKNTSVYDSKLIDILELNYTEKL